MNKIHVGIDPGKNGAVVIMLPIGKIEPVTFPLVGNEYDLKGLSDIFSRLIVKGIPRSQQRDIHVVLEDVHALQKPYDSGNWSLSGCKHAVMMALTIHDIPYTLVAPKAWQKEMWVGVPEQREPGKTVKDKNGNDVFKPGKMKTKEMSEMAAKRLFPSFDLRDPDRKTNRAQKVHDGVVDALLMCEYSRRKFD